MGNMTPLHYFLKHRDLARTFTASSLDPGEKHYKRLIRSYDALRSYLLHGCTYDHLLRVDAMQKSIDRRWQNLH
jgi:hypothetical protein